MKCQFCGYESDESSRFCVKCGKSLSEAISDTAETTKSESDNSKTAEPAVSDAVTAEPEAITPESVDNPAEDTANSLPGNNAPESSAPEKTAEEIPSFESNGQSGYSSAPNPEFTDEYIPDEPQPVEVIRPSKPSGGRIFASVLISILAVIVLTLFNVLLPARLGLCRDAAAKSVKSIDTGDLLETRIDSDKTVSDYIFENVQPSFIENVGAEQDDVDEFIEESEIIDFASGHISNYAGYLIDGSVTKDPAIETDDIMDFIHDSDDVFEDVFDYKLTKKDYSDFENSLSDLNIDDKLSLDYWSDEIDFNLGTVHFAFSFITIGILFALAVVICIWIAIILGKHASAIFGFFGTITVIGGCLILIPSLIGLFMSLFVTPEETLAYITLKFAYPVTLFGAATGAAELVIGIIFLLIKKFIRKRAAKKIAAN